MATSYDVNLNIGSAIGFNVVGAGLMHGVTPIQTTTLTLDGDVFPPAGYNVGTRVLSINVLDDFILVPGTTSTRQLVNMTNNGNSVMTVTDILYGLTEGISPWFYFYPGVTVVNSATITILPNSTASFQLAYIAPEVGEYSSYFIVQSTNDSGYYKVNTRQLVVNTANFYVTPTSFATTVTSIGHNELVNYNIIPVVNNIDRPDLVIPVSGTISGSPAWSILSTGTNAISVNFDPNEINNVNGIYESDLTISANGATHSVTNTATVSINAATNKNFANWMSPASHYNSIVGVSYDMLEGVKQITIGVGMGADGSDIYGSGGSIFANTANLGLGAETVQYPYPFWANVYRIPLTGAAQTYTSNDYIVKTTEGVDYSGYFGEYSEPGSMFIVYDDGYGSITIEMNHLRELSGDAETDATLQNLTRAFYYYSEADVDGRYLPLPAEYANPIASNIATTRLFIGFNYNTKLNVARINTSIVELPL
jgi:hypothetical protein